ncbi:MAG TPA: PD-(D/E)XK nuclease family protein, partial [Thermodesulfobacteriota bacterium]
GRLAPPVPPLPDADRERLAAFAAWWWELRGRKDRTPPSDLVEEALERSGYRSVCLTRRDGDQQVANLRKLVEMTRAFEARGGRTLRDLVVELGALVDEEPRETPAELVGEGEDVVRIMTIHAAKGLEFPVVVVPGCSATWRSTHEAVVFDEGPDGAGLAVRPLDLDTLDRCPTWLGRRIQAAVDAREAAEWRRLFYVAATRAKTRLILVGEHPVRKDGGLTTADTWRRAVEEALSSRPDLVRRLTWDDLAALPEPGDAPPDAPAAVPAAADAAIARLRWRPPLPTRFVLSATELCDLAACPQRYYLTRRLGLREPPDPWFDGGDEPGEPETAPSPVDRGRLVHAVLEHAPLGLEWGALTRAVRELVRTHAAGVPGGLGEAEQASLAESIVAFLDSRSGRSLAAAWRRAPDTVFREHPIALRLSDGATSLSVRGQVDVLWRDEDGTWTVLDYKTTRGGADAAPRYELQLLAYADAAARVAGGGPVRAGFAFLLDRPDEPYWLDAGAAALARMRSRALAIVREAAEREGDDGEAWPRIDRARCEALRCGFVGRCHGRPPANAGTRSAG